MRGLKAAQLTQFPSPPRRSLMGHEEPILARRRVAEKGGQPTFAGTRASDKVAPIPAIRASTKLPLLPKRDLWATKQSV
jgi:hypothetical protein